MRKLLTLLFLLVSMVVFSQNNGINFQGIGRNSSGAVLASTKLTLRFTVLQVSETGTIEYVESKEVLTNAQGIFSTVIGDGTQISKTGNFSDINWKINPKFLKVEMDPAGGTSFIAMGTTRLQSVPFAYYANGVNADNVDGVLSASKGGTGVASISALKTALGIDQINNTSDLAKPISTATQVALDTKVSTTTFSTTVDTKANVTDVALKAPIESPTFTGTVSGITKAMVGLGVVDNTSDLSKPISALMLEALNTKVSNATFSSTLTLFENSSNKASAIDLGGNNPSDILYPTQKAVKEYIAANSASGGVADGGITTIKLADGAVTDSKITSVSGSKILGNILGNAATVTTNANLTGVVTSVGNATSIANRAITNAMLSNTAVSNLTGINTGDETEASIKSKLGVTNFFSGTYSDLTGKPLLFGGSYNDLSNKPDLTLKENSNNKSINFIMDAASDIKFPTVKAVKGYVDATNLSLSNSLVSLTTDQPISGMKTFYNDLTISNIGGIASTTPATINFANGSKIGDIQNISEGSPDPDGSIDLFAPSGASWVQMNYGNFNYIWLTSEAAKFDIGAYRWLFDESGNTEFPGNLKLGATIFPSAPGNNGDILTFDQGNAVWQAPTGGTGTNGISLINGVSSGTQSFTTGNVGNDFSIESDINTGVHTFIIPDASINSRGLLTGADYATFSGKQDALYFATNARDGYLKSSDFLTFSAKQDALTNPVTGTGSSGQLSFFNGTTTVASSSNLMWDATHHRLGIGTTFPGYPVEINTGASNYGLMISSESSNSWGSGIGFKSSTDAVEKTGLFQLDRDGAMVFRTFQDNMYFDNAGSGSINFRMGDPNVSNIGMTLNNSGNLEVTGTLKTGAIIYPNVSGTLGDVLTADASGNPIWQAPTGNNSSSNLDAGTLSGTTLNSTITNSSLTSVGTLANLSVSNPINGSITGNAATVTTNANLTGVVTSIGNLTSIASGTITNSMLANTAVANLSGVNTGDNAINTRYNNLVTNAVHFGDIRAMMTGSDAYYVIGINGTRLLDLPTGILKNTTGTGVPSIAVASDFPTLNQSTTGNAATSTKLSTSKNINGVAFDGTSDITIAADAGTLTGNTLKSTVINSSLTSVGTLTNLTVTNTINGSVNGSAASATTANKLTNARNINGTAFDGTSDVTITSDAGTLTGTTLKSSVINSSLTTVGTLANLTVTNTINGSINGNAASASTATKLTNARNINGVAFDGTSNITVAASAGTLTGTTLNATVTGSSLTSVGVLNNATVNGKVIVGASSETSASAILEASSTTQGFLPPRMTIAQRLAIVNPAQGLIIYCTNCGTYGEPQYYNGNSWMNFAGTATSKGTPTITISVGTYTYTGAAQGPTSATNTGTGSTYSFTYVGTGSTTYASSSTKPTNAGTYSVTVSLSASGDGNYNAASASAAFTIAQAIPTVTPTVGTYAYSGSAQGPTAATNTGTGTSYTFSYTGTGITSYGPSSTKPTDGGTYTVIATVAANGNYAASSSSATAFKISLNLAVGNTYGGGKVAYILKAGDIGYDANQQHGLIVSGDLTIPDINWGINNVVTGASGGAPDIDGIYPPADLETGMSNTNIIINSEGSGTNYAAGLARAYQGGGYTNWYLPSASQMNAMKANLSAINSFTKVHYWTSTENDYLAAYALYATSGAQVESFDKINTQVGVRAVRSF